MPASPRLKPPLTYFGGKTAIADRIAALLPEHEHYVEPFAGSLAVLLAKRPSGMETVNDLDGDLMTFWRVLRDQPEALERACALTPHSRAEHAAALDLDGCSDLERARRVWVRLTQGRGGHVTRKTGWRYYQDPCGSSASMAAYLDGYTGRIAAAAARLHSVSLECRPAIEVITAYGQHPGCLIYADPPYLRSVRSGRTASAGYTHEMLTGDDHAELLAALLACRSAVVLSGYASPLYDEALGGWARAEVATETGNGVERVRTEILWSNRPFPQGTLFDASEVS